MTRPRLLAALLLVLCGLGAWMLCGERTTTEETTQAAAEVRDATVAAEPAAVTREALPSSKVGARHGVPARSPEGEPNLIVRVLDVHGAPIPFVATVYAGYRDRITKKDNVAMALTSSGTARLHVAAASDVALHLCEEGAPLGAGEAPAPRPGEVVTCEVRLTRERATLTGRLLGPDLAPLAGVVTRLSLDVGAGSERPLQILSAIAKTNAPRAVQLEPGAGASADWLDSVSPTASAPTSAGLTVTTDAAGRFTATLVYHLATRPLRSLAAAVGADLRATVTPGITLRPGTNDVGDVVLVRRCELLTCRVVDDRGSAVVGARLTVAASDGRDLAGLLEVTSGRGGRFEVLGWFEPSRGVQLFASAACEGYAAATPVPFVPGQKDLRVELPRGGTVVALVRGAGGAAGALQLEPRAAGAARHGATRVEPREQHQRLVWNGLAPGTYDLRLRDADTTVVAGLEVRAGGVCADTRLLDVDLGAAATR